MKTIEFKTKIINNIIKIPDRFKKNISSKEKKVRVILLLEESEDEQDFQILTQQQFLKGYSDSDAIYDNY